MSLMGLCLSWCPLVGQRCKISTPWNHKKSILLCTICKCRVTLNWSQFLVLIRITFVLLLSWNANTLSLEFYWNKSISMIRYFSSSAALKSSNSELKARNRQISFVVRGCRKRVLCVVVKKFLYSKPQFLNCIGSLSGWIEALLRSPKTKYSRPYNEKKCHTELHLKMN